MKLCWWVVTLLVVGGHLFFTHPAMIPKFPEGKQSHEDKLVLLHDSCTTRFTVLYTYRYCANVHIYMHEYMYMCIYTYMIICTYMYT